jgi:hypothetical protein
MTTRIRTKIAKTTLAAAAIAAVAVLALGVATGLVGLGEWITPASSQSKTAPVGTACGTIAPATMPLSGCRQLLTNMYLGTGMPCGTIMPRTMPTQECRRVLERVFLGPR